LTAANKEFYKPEETQKILLRCETPQKRPFVAFYATFELHTSNAIFAIDCRILLISMAFFPRKDARRDNTLAPTRECGKSTKRGGKNHSQIIERGEICSTILSVCNSFPLSGKFETDHIAFLAPRHAQRHPRNPLSTHCACSIRNSNGRTSGYSGR